MKLNIKNKKMSTFDQIVLDWFNNNHHNEKINFMIITLDDRLMNGLIDLFKTHDKINKIFIYPGFGEEKLSNDNKVLFSKNYDSNKLITVTTNKQNSTNKCILFCDFINSTYLTINKHDYFDIIDRNDYFRKKCNSIIMYNYTGLTFNTSYWIHDSKLIKDDCSLEILKKSKWAELCTSIKAYDRNKDKVENFKQFLNNILTKIIGTDEYNEEILSHQNLPTWIQSITHETYNQKYSYDRLEFLGDTIFKSKLAIYIQAVYPNLNAGELTNYITEYISRNYMSLWCNDLNLFNYIIVEESLRNVLADNIKIKCDLFESFIGALYQTCSIVDESLANVACSNLITLIGNSLTFEKKLSFGRPQHRFTQILDSAGLKYSQDKDYYLQEEKNLVEEGEVYNILYLVFKPESFNILHNIERNKGLPENEITHKLQTFWKYSPLEITDINIARNAFWEGKCKVLEEYDIDIDFIKTQKMIEEDYFDKVSKFDPELIQLARLKLSKIMNNNDKKLSNYVQFIFNRDNGYIIMYIHTEKLKPDSSLTKLDVSLSEKTQTASYDYLNKNEAYVQNVNLSVVEFPNVKQVIKDKTTGKDIELIPKDLGIYNAIKKFVN